MTQALISDLSRTLLFPIDANYRGSLNSLYKELQQKYPPGFNFFDYFKWNQDLHDYYQSLRQKHDIDIYIFTTDAIQEDPAVSGIIETTFSRVFTIRDFTASGKDDKTAYEQLLDKVGLTASDCIYVDDSLTNIQAATAAGLIAIKFENNGQVIVDINAQVAATK